jgi:hypothetical protein
MILKRRLTGNLRLAGNLRLTGNLRLPGNLRLAGNLRLTGNLRLAGNLPPMVAGSLIQASSQHLGLGIEARVPVVQF